MKKAALFCTTRKEGVIEVETVFLACGKCWPSAGRISDWELTGTAYERSVYGNWRVVCQNYCFKLSRLRREGLNKHKKIIKRRRTQQSNSYLKRKRGMRKTLFLAKELANLALNCTVAQLPPPPLFPCCAASVRVCPLTHLLRTGGRD